VTPFAKKNGLVGGPSGLVSALAQGKCLGLWAELRQFLTLEVLMTGLKNRNRRGGGGRGMRRRVAPSDRTSAPFGHPSHL
jgi:hypothetical protein